VHAFDSGIDSLEGIGEYDWTTATELRLQGNQLSSIGSGDFDGLIALRVLDLQVNQLSSIESGAFSGLTNLEWLFLSRNHISNLESGTFSGLTNLESLTLWGNNLARLNLAEADFSSLFAFFCDAPIFYDVSLKNAVLNPFLFNIGCLREVWESPVRVIDLSGIDFGNFTDLELLYAMDDLTDLWLVDTQNLDAIDLDELLDNLETFEGTDVEGILYMAEANFDAFNAAGGGLLAAWHAEPGHHVAFGPERVLGDLNLDGEVNGLDVDPFVDVLLNRPYWTQADMNEDERVNGLDVDPFVVALGGGGAQQIPEPSTLFLAALALLGLLAHARRRSTA
jgi:hypothetical protein